MLKLCCFICNKTVTDCPENTMYSLTEQSHIPIHEFITKYLFQSLLGESSGICGYCKERINNLDIAIDRLDKQKKVLLDEIEESRKKRSPEKSEFEFVNINPGPVKAELFHDDPEDDDMSVDNDDSSDPDYNTEEDNEQKFEQRNSVLECVKCNLTFETMSEFKKHNQIHDQDVHICDICGKSYTTNAILIQHAKTHPESWINKPHFRCEFCGKYYAKEHQLARHMKQHKSQMDGTITLEKRKCRQYNNEDRKKIFDRVANGEDFNILADEFGIPRRTVRTWIQRGRIENKKRIGTPKVASNVQNFIWDSIEEDPKGKMVDLKRRIAEKFGLSLSLSTLSKYITDKCYRVYKKHSTEVNSKEYKIQRAEYVLALTHFVEKGMRIIYIGEANFILLFRHIKEKPEKKRNSKPSLSRKPNINLFGAMSEEGIISISMKRGTFVENETRDWIVNILNQWQGKGNSLTNLLIVCDCEKETNLKEFKAAIESVNNNGQASFLPLSPWSPMLSPLENIWTIIQQSIRGKSIESESVSDSLDYFESLIEGVKTNDLNPEFCKNAVQKSTEFYAKALSQENFSNKS